MTTLTAADLKRNEYLLLFFFLYTTFQGALRKWVFMGVAGTSDILFGLQLLMPFLIVFAMKREKTIFSCKPLIPFALLLIIMALNPMNHTLYHGFFGFIMHYGFWLIMLVYLNEREAFPLEKLIPILLIVCIGETILTFVQFGLPTTHFLNRYEHAGEDEIAGFANDGGVRVIGTFSYISGYGSFLFFAGLFVWALMVEKKQFMPVILAMAGLGLVSSFMNGSRGVLLPYALFVILGFISYGSLVNKVKSIVLIVVLFAAVTISGMGGKFDFVGKSFTSFAQRVTSGQQTGEAQSRTEGIFAETLGFSGKYPLFGMGLGATYQGATGKWGRAPEVIAYGYYEEDPERVIIEGGYLLLLVRIALFAYMAHKMTIPIIYSIPIIFYMFFFTIFVFNIYQSAYVFFGLALLDKVYEKKNALKETDSP